MPSRSQEPGILYVTLPTRLRAEGLLLGGGGVRVLGLRVEASGLQGLVHRFTGEGSKQLNNTRILTPPSQQGDRVIAAAPHEKAATELQPKP